MHRFFLVSVFFYGTRLLLANGCLDSLIFFSADHHFGHKKIIEYAARPFDGVEEMNEALIKKWNAVVRPQDTVYYLGDFSLIDESSLEIVARLNGTIHLILGNHDSGHPLSRLKNPDASKAYLDAGFASVSLSKQIDIAGHPVLLHHFPYAPTNPKNQIKHAAHRPKNEGLWLLHGHVHGNWKLNTKMINVGVDVWGYQPVSLSEIEALINSTETTLD